MIARDTIVLRSLRTIARQHSGFDEMRCHALLELLATADLVRGKVRDELRGIPLTELQLGTLVVLRALDPEPVWPTTLASHTCAKQATITDVLDRLLERQLIVRERGKQDRRNYLITLTDAGRETTDKAVSIVLLTLAEQARGLTEPAPRALVAICDKIGSRAGLATEAHLQTHRISTLP